MDVVTDITSKSEKYPFVEKTKEQVQLLKNTFNI